ncbi:H(+)-transporting V1 sector ATPase subunit H [Sugiyamaella lignohabitans]|uniref:V-type proton ATPase subunit H n=1 Tax=Sugiyamaella lignohabitans TaxID=796027 RepID=A0A167FH48_9ASCO|nr:H(+)-transporting V1 sector ATPase subunit H [Sugiyamaella lignohabitans]ANB15291.1 H(+)-transporting V1 sector ATPase subunit H [Sugiyamaella lignohabitans]
MGENFGSNKANVSLCYSSPISSQYLEEIQSNIRVRPIPWEGYVRANLITTEEASLIKTIEKLPKDKSVAIIAKDSDIYAAKLIGILSRITRDDVVKYILSLVGDFASDSPEFRESLLGLKDPQTFDVLTKLLDKPDEQTHLLSIKALITLIGQSSDDKSAVKLALAYISKKLASSPNANLQDIAVQAYSSLLQVKKFRPLFWESRNEIVPSLIKILNASQGNLQLQYYTLLVFWLVTFEKQPAADVVTEFDLVPTLLNITKNSVKEKIVRLAVATLVNTINNASKVSVPALLSHSCLELVKTLAERKWTDEELIEDLDFLKTTLQEAFDSMTTFDEYGSEIIGKNLKWSPPHRSETFWKENIGKFKEGDWKILKALSNIITSSQDPVTLAVGSNDVSRIISELPESLKVFEKLGTKVKIMELMNHPDSDVRYEALKATQTFIAHSFK